MSEQTKEIIRKWYGLLEIPQQYREGFEQAMKTIDIPEDTCIETYDQNCRDGARNYLAFLYMCEEAERRFRERGVDRKIILETLKDIRAQADRYYEFGKTFYLGELDWLAHHLSARLFKLGRLQFAFGEARCDADAYGMEKGEPILEVHIDASGPLLPAQCDQSFAMAEAFFASHFPEYSYRFYTCHSWLLGSNLDRIVRKGSNLESFRNRFLFVEEEPCEDILKYVFKWNTVRDNVALEEPRNEFSKKVKQEALAGDPFYIGYGIIPHDFSRIPALRSEY